MYLHVVFIVCCNSILICISHSASCLRSQCEAWDQRNQCDMVVSLYCVQHHIGLFLDQG